MRHAVQADGELARVGGEVGADLEHLPESPIYSRCRQRHRPGGGDQGRIDVDRAATFVGKGEPRHCDEVQVAEPVLAHPARVAGIDGQSQQVREAAIDSRRDPPCPWSLEAWSEERHVAVGWPQPRPSATLSGDCARVAEVGAPVGRRHVRAYAHDLRFRCHKAGRALRRGHEIDGDGAAKLANAAAHDPRRLAERSPPPPPPPPPPPHSRTHVGLGRKPFGAPPEQAVHCRIVGRRVTEAGPFHTRAVGQLQAWRRAPHVTEITRRAHAVGGAVARRQRAPERDGAVLLQIGERIEAEGAVDVARHEVRGPRDVDQRAEPYAMATRPGQPRHLVACFQAGAAGTRRDAGAAPEGERRRPLRPVGKRGRHEHTTCW